MADIDRNKTIIINNNQPTTTSTTTTTTTTNIIKTNVIINTTTTSNTIIENQDLKNKRDDNNRTDVNNCNNEKPKETQQDEQTSIPSTTIELEKEFNTQVLTDPKDDKMDYILEKEKMEIKDSIKKNEGFIIEEEEEQLKMYLKQELDKVQHQKDNHKESNNTGVKGLMLNDHINNKNEKDKMDIDNKKDHGIENDSNNNDNVEEDDDEDDDENEEEEEDENINGIVTKSTKRGKRTPYKTATAEQLDILVDEHINSKLSISAAARKAGIARSTAATLMKKYKLNQGHIPARRPRGRTAPPTLSSVHTQWIDEFLRQNQDATLSKIKQHLLIAHPSIPHISISALQRHISIKCEMNLKRARK